MANLGDVYVDVHANTRSMRREVRNASRGLDKEGRVGGKAYGDGFSSEVNQSINRVRRMAARDSIIDLDDDSSSVDNFARSAAKATGRLNLLGVGMAGLIALAGPAAAAVGGLALALGGPLGAAGGGGGLFAILAGKYIGETNKVLKQIEQLKKAGKVGEANALIAKLSDAQKAYMKARADLTSAFKSFVKENDAALLGPFTKSIRILSKTMPELSPVIQAVSDSVEDLLDEFAKSGTIKRFIKFMERFSGPTITGTGHAIGDLTGIFGTLFGQAMPLGMDALDALGESLRRFNKYLKSDEGRKQTQEFLDWVRVNGPVMGKALVQAGIAIKDIYKAISPAAVGALKVLGDLLGVVSKLLTKMGPLADDVGGLALALVAIKFGVLGETAAGFLALGGAGGKAGKGMETAGVAAGGLSGSLKLLAKRAALVGIAFGAWELSKTFVKNWKLIHHGLDDLEAKFVETGATSKESIQQISDLLGRGDISGRLGELGVSAEGLATSIAKNGTEGARFKQVIADLQAVASSDKSLWDKLLGDSSRQNQAKQLIEALKSIGGEVEKVSAKTANFKIGNFETLGLISQQVADRLRSLPPSVSIQFLTPGLLPTTKAFAEFAAQAKLYDRKTIQTLLQVQGLPAAKADVDAMIALIKQTIKLNVDADTEPAELQLHTYKQTAESTAINLIIGGDPKTYNTVLATAVKKGNKTLVKALLTANPGLFNTVLKDAKLRGDTTTTKMLLDAIDEVSPAIEDIKKSEPGVDVTVNAKKGSGWTARFSAWWNAFSVGGQIPKGFASGGMVPGRTPGNKAFDNVAGLTRRGNPIRVQSGEWIINSRMSKKNDRLLAAINAGFDAQKAYNFSGGGLVPVKQKAYASGGLVAGNSVTHADNRNVTINLNEYGPRSGNAKVRDVNWYARFGTGTRITTAGVPG